MGKKYADLKIEAYINGALSAESAHNYIVAMELYWNAIRTKIFSLLDDKGVEYKSTEEALAAISRVLEDGLAEKINSAYSIGVLAGWDDTLLKKDRNELTEGVTLMKDVANTLGLLPQKKEIDLERLRNNLFEKSYKLFRFVRIYKIAITALAIVLLLWLDFSEAPHTYAVVSSIVLVVSVILYMKIYLDTKKSRVCYTSAEQLKQYIFLKNIYPNDFQHEHIGGVLSSLDEKILEASKVYPKMDKQDHYLSRTEDPLMMLLDRLLENTYFTCTLHRRFAKRIFSIILLALIFVLIIIVLILIMSYYYEGNPLIVSRILIPIVGVLFALDYFSYYRSFRDKSHLLEVIYQKVKELRAAPNAPRALALNDFYNSVLWDAYPMNTTFFLNHVAQINELVRVQLNNDKK